MIALLQRVAQARVEIEGHTVGSIGSGLLLLICAEPNDTDVEADRLVDRVLGLRVFADGAGRMNLSLQQTGGGLLVVSQFTLAADTAHGRRPSFDGAAPAAQGERIYKAVLARARARHPVVEAGRFGAYMRVHLVNDGPVTIPLAIR